MENRIFKIRCSEIGKIMGEVGLTENQKTRLAELQERNLNPLAKPLTDNMKKELAELVAKNSSNDLPQTCKSYLRKWYANDNEEIYSKYLRKGHAVEIDLIDFMADQLNLGMAEKNQEYKEDEWFTGTCDVNHPDFIVDTKAPWDKESLLDYAINPVDKDNELQVRGYMHLYNKPKAILFYGLMDTPSDIAYTDEDVIYSNLPDNQRWTAFEVLHDADKIEAIKQRVIQCREYLSEYDKLVKSKLGKVNA